MKIDKKYLPSKEWIARITILAILFGIVLAIYGIVAFFKTHKIFGKSVALTQKQVEVRDLIGKDSNKNGIADWEEAFWGLDPYKDGDANKEIILAKRAHIAKNEGGDTTNTGSLSENETFAREFFAVIMSLQQTGDLNDDTLKKLTEDLGKNLLASAPLVDTYTKSDLKTKTTNTESIKTYYENFKAIVSKYGNEDIGNELTFIVLGLKNTDEQSLSIAKEIAEAYRNFAKDLMATPVPTSLANTQLSIANNYTKEAESIDGLARLIEDPVISMKSLINYKNYNEAIVSDLQELRTFFQRNGIIKNNE